MFSLRQAFNWLDSALWLGACDGLVVGVCTDTRVLKPAQLFVAIRGENFDANQLAAQACERGAAALVLDDEAQALSIRQLHPNVSVFLVANGRAALAQLGAAWRKQFDIPVIAVTGSNGKTTVKEMISSILSAAYGADCQLATAGNLNNDIGVPLSVFRLHAGHRAAVLELGMNHPGEIAAIAAVAQPTVALVNNAQREHQEFMQTVRAVAIENATVFDYLPVNGTAVFPGDDEFSALWADMTKSKKQLRFGFDSKLDISTGAQSQPRQFEVEQDHAKVELNLNIAGQHNVRNALAASACARAIGLPWTAIAQGLKSFEPVAGRLVTHQLSLADADSYCTVIDDTYNANPDSVLAAIQVLSTCARPRLLVLGDMGEVGENGPQFHQEIGLAAARSGIENLFTLGQLAQHACKAFVDELAQAELLVKRSAMHFDSIEALNIAVAKKLSKHLTILVKGSRFMRMERVVQPLLQNQGLSHVT
jgi:UDP-N-acetylmuramoyl-tripeptide--D-alanyl-D-alanine ligase